MANQTKRKPRRSKAQLDIDMMSALERIVGEKGFIDIPIYQFTELAHIDHNVFSRRINTVDELFDRLASKYDFWINNAFNIADLNELGPKKFYAEALKKLFHELQKNKVMQKLLLWELTDHNQTTTHTSAMRETMILNIMAYYSNIFKSVNIDIKCFTSILISGIFYLVLYKERSTLCSIDFNSQQGEDLLNQTIDTVSDMLFQHIEQHNQRAAIIKRMAEDGISQAKICDYLGITLTEFKRCYKSK